MRCESGAGVPASAHRPGKELALPAAGFMSEMRLYRLEKCVSSRATWSERRASMNTSYLDLRYSRRTTDARSSSGAWAVQLLVLCTMLSSPALFRHAPELEGPAESSAIGQEFACERTNTSRLRTKTDLAPIAHGTYLAGAIGRAAGRPTRGAAPRWLRHDLAAPLLC